MLPLRGNFAETAASVSEPIPIDERPVQLREGSTIYRVPDCAMLSNRGRQIIDVTATVAAEFAASLVMSPATMEIPNTGKFQTCVIDAVMQSMEGSIIRNPAVWGRITAHKKSKRITGDMADFVRAVAGMTASHVAHIMYFRPMDPWDEVEAMTRQIAYSALGEDDPGEAGADHGR